MLSDDICDGILHCFHGEDEDFEMCEHTFPEFATIKCIENRLLGYNVTIMAVPCDGIIECRDGSDEDCQVNEVVLYTIMVTFLFITFLIWCWIMYKVKKYKDIQRNVSIELAEVNYKSFKGDDLAKLKVSFHLGLSIVNNFHTTMAASGHHGSKAMCRQIEK